MVAKVALGLILLSGAAHALPATVDYIIDGDTFGATVVMAPDISADVRVRIINVDTPEIHGNCTSEINAAYRAKERIAQLIPVGSVVELSEIKDDKYLGRIDARVRDGSGHDIGAILISEKLGRAYNGGRRASWCDMPHK